MAVVTTRELSNYMSGWRYTGVQELDAQSILDGVQSELELYLNRPLQMRRTIEDVTTDYRGYAYMKVTPITAVHGVYETDRDGLQSDLITTLPSNFFRRGANYLVTGRANCRIVVDYTGGQNADLHPGVKLAIKRVAAREFGFKHDDAVTLDNTEGRPAEDPTPVPKGWTEEELKKFDRMRRRVIV